MKNLDNKTFEHLLKSMKCDTGTDLTLIGFSSSFANTVLSFCSEFGTDEISIDDCYHELNNVVTYLATTVDQRASLLELVISKADEVEYEMRAELELDNTSWGSNDDYEVATNVIYR